MPQDLQDEIRFSFYHFTKLMSLLFAVILLFFVFAFANQKFPKLNGLFSLTLLIVLFIIRFLMLKYNFSESFIEFALFGPELFAESFWMPSLGDYLINVLFFIAFAVFSFAFFKPKKQVARKPKLKLDTEEIPEPPVGNEALNEEASRGLPE